MKTKVNQFGFLACLFLATQALAGGVSEGGGGTTNPKPADPEWIAYQAPHDAGFVIISWLNREQSNFANLSEAEQRKSPLWKIFHNAKDFYNVVRTTQIELRMAEPCRDATGAPKDGSIFATQPGTICISPFTMAPKLTEFNFESETIALIIHEMSHLVGTSEDEAVAIQQEALVSFEGLDFLHARVSLDLLGDDPNHVTGGIINESLFMIDIMIQSPQSLRQREIESWDNGLLQLRDYRLNMDFSALMFVNPKKYALLTPKFVVLDALKDSVCANDKKEDDDERKACQKELDTGFQGASEVTADQFETRTTQSSSYGPEYDQVTLHKISSLADLAQELTRLRDYVYSLRDEVRELGKFQIPTYRNTDTK